LRRRRSSSARSLSHQTLGTSRHRFLLQTRYFTFSQTDLFNVETMLLAPLLSSSSSSSSTTFIATQVLNNTSVPLCVTYYTTAVIPYFLSYFPFIQSGSFGERCELTTHQASNIAFHASCLVAIYITCLVP